jgi:hypothetical protein
MLYAIGRRSKTHPEVIRFLRDATTCGGRAFSPLVFDSVSDAEAEIATHTPNKYFVVPIPTLAKVNDRIEVATVSIRKPSPRKSRSKVEAARKPARKVAKKVAKKSKSRR